MTLLHYLQVLDAREPQPVGADCAGVRVHTDQPVVPDERHASAAHQTAPELREPRAHRRPESGKGRADPSPFVRHTLHTHPVPASAQDDRGNSLSDILGDTGVHPSEYSWVKPLSRRRDRNVTAAERLVN